MPVPSRRVRMRVCRVRALHFDRSGPIRCPSRRQVWPQHSSTFPYVGRLPLHSVPSSAATATTSANTSDDTSTHAWRVHDRRRHHPGNRVMVMVMAASVAVMMMMVVMVAMVMMVVMMASATVVTASSAATSVVITVYCRRLRHIVIAVSTHRTAWRQVICSYKHFYFVFNTCEL